MFKNYLDVALRSFLGNKLFSFINVVGLAVGLASAILIGLYVADEFAYDRFHPDYERVYRIGRDIYPREDFAGLYMATLPPIAAEQLLQDYPEIELAARARPNAGLLAHDEVQFFENRLLYADPALLDIIGFEWLAGDSATALDEPASIVLTESLARKYFGNEPALGQRLTYENTTDLTVTGVIRDLPHNTHLRADALQPLAVNLATMPPAQLNAWLGNMMHTYVRLAPAPISRRSRVRFPPSWTVMSTLPVLGRPARSPASVR